MQFQLDFYEILIRVLKESAIPIDSYGNAKAFYTIPMRFLKQDLLRIPMQLLLISVEIPTDSLSFALGFPLHF